jgi:acetyl-CoA synthetase
VSRGGAIGKPVPGHEVAIIDAEGGSLCRRVRLGQIAVRRPDPVMFLEYWQNPEATAKKFIGDWMTTGDQGIVEDGYIRFFGRDDDVITSSGYRIGPGEIEDCLTGHPAVALAAAVGKPDPMRTEIVKAYIVLNDGFDAGERWPPRSANGCASGCRRTNIRARWNSSIRCR